MKKIYYSMFCILCLLMLTACSKKDESSSALIDNNNREEASVTPAVTTFITPTAVPTVTPTSAPTSTPIPTIDTKEQRKEENSKYTIVIDAGHQRHQNSDPEPNGPGAKETKAKVSSGTQGRFTDVPEYKVNLEVALKLRDILEEQGYQVIMVRETHDVDISNSQRAKIANDNDADAFVRIHCNGSEDPSVHGILTICPTSDNPYCSEIYGDSRRLSDAILESLCNITGADNKGVMETDTMSGINWSQVPVTIVEMGYMTNKTEDYKLTDSAYQDLLAKGIAEGIEAYLK